MCMLTPPRGEQPLQQKLVQQIAQDPALKHMAQKAFVSYLRSVHLQVITRKRALYERARYKKSPI